MVSIINGHTQHAEAVCVHKAVPTSREHAMNAHKAAPTNIEQAMHAHKAVPTSTKPGMHAHKAVPTSTEHNLVIKALYCSCSGMAEATCWEEIVHDQNAANAGTALKALVRAAQHSNKGIVAATLELEKVESHCLQRIVCRSGVLALL